MTTILPPAQIAAEIRACRHLPHNAVIDPGPLLDLADLAEAYFVALDRWDAAAELDTELVAAAAALNATEGALRNALGLQSSAEREVTAAREVPSIVAALRVAGVEHPLPRPPWWQRAARALRTAVPGLRRGQQPGGRR